MKKLVDIKNAPHLIIQCVITRDDMFMLDGVVWWDDLKFRGTVVCGSDEAGWEHVSVSSYKRNQLPSWEVMCRLKNMFWDKEECVVQIHPKESQYVHGVNGLENVLHLWRPVNGDWSVMNE